jgi:hypothetical protein
MSLSPGLSKQTNDNLRYGPSLSDEDSPFRIASVVKNYTGIPGQTTPETEVNEYFLSSLSQSLSSSGGSLIIPVNIFYKDVSSPSSVIIARRNDCKVLEVKHKCEQEKHKMQTAMRLYKYRIRLNRIPVIRYFTRFRAYFLLVKNTR